MHSITTLEHVSREAIRDMAHAAAERGEHLADANPFPVGSRNNDHFALDFHQRDRELADTA